MPGEVGLLAIFLCPMIFGGITFVYSHNAIHQETLNRWMRQGYDYHANQHVDCPVCSGEGRIKRSESVRYQDSVS